MTRQARISELLMGTLCGQAMLVFGLWLAFAQWLASSRLAAALALMAGGMYLAMVIVIDPLVPGAGRVFVGLIKSAVAIVFYASAALVIYGMGSGRASELLQAL